MNEFMINGLYARIDWLEFTITDYCSDISLIDNVDLTLDLFGISFDLFNESGKGGLGYKRSARHITENIFVFFDGNADMGIHIRISGSSIGYVLKCFLNKFECDTPFGIGYDVGEYDVANILPLFCDTVLNVGHFTRIDLAIDDIGCNYYRCNDVVRLLDNGQCISKFKKWQNVKGNSFVGDCNGHTVYMGSRESDVFLRIYEKGLEQNVSIDWVRWELEIKHSKADVVANQILSMQNLGSIAIGILKSYLRFINLDNSRRSRCSLHSVWSAFIDNVEGLRLVVPQSDKSIEDKMNWINKQCMPTIAGLIVAHSGDISFLRDKLEEHFDRLSPKDKHLFLSALEKGVV